MENIKKYWNENLSDKAKIIIVSFFTFLSFICAAMTNSIVSAYDNVDGYYLRSLNDVISSYDSYLVKTLSDGSRQYYFFDSKTTFSYTNNEIYGYGVYAYTNCIYDIDKSCFKSRDESNLNGKYISQAYFSWSRNCITNNKPLYDLLVSNGFSINFQQTPTVNSKMVEQIPVGIKKTMTILIPVGLVIFGAILGIYLIKRLVVLSL